MGPTKAIISKKNLYHNFSYLTDKFEKKISIIAIVKANAYGHVAVEISKILSRKKIDYLGVANIQEANELIDHGIKKRILILGSISNHEISEAIDKKITFTVYDIRQLNFIRNIKKKIKIKFHLKIDTGMNRLGISESEIDEAILRLKNNSNLEFEGLFTHLVEADNKKSQFTQKQLKSFNRIVEKFQDHFKKIKYIHAANSSGILNFKKSYFNTVRPGILLYGLSHNKKLKPVMNLETKIIKLRMIEKGESVSYGRTFKAKKKMKIAVIPIGYADGLPRSLSNIGHVYCNGKKCKILGRVCMDLTMIDVSTIKSVSIDDTVKIFDDTNQSATQLAKKIKTIPYDIVCGISKRVKRIYT